jgi:cytochrome c biogenesis protein CcmG, thiol:disulfide interchange protein DsbE
VTPADTKPEGDGRSTTRVVGAAVALAVIALVVYVMAKGFGTDPHAVPFLLAGKPAPNFTIKRLDTGATVSLSDFKGKPIVMNFWATWCAPCKYEIPVLEYVSRQYADRVVFLGVVFEDTEQNTKRFVVENNWSYTQLFDPKSTIAVDYGVSGVPETYFISREGVIVSKTTSPFSDPRELIALMKPIL